MSKILLFGEPMALLIADTIGPLEEVEHFTRSLSGAEVNVAIGLTRLGHDVEYFTRLGNDPFGYYIKSALEKQGIGTSLINYDDIYKTGIQLKNRVSDGSDPYAPYYRKCSAASQITTQMVEQIDLANFQLLHVTGIPLAISQSSREATLHLVKKAKQNNLIVTFDPNLRPTLWENEATMVNVINEVANYADVILPGLAEANILTNTNNIDDICAFYHARGVKTVIVKVGEKGAYYSSSSHKAYVAGYKVAKVVDTVGAGDGFAVGVISGLVEGLALPESINRANAIGAMQVTSLSDNAALPTRKGLETFLSSNSVL